MYKHYRTWIKIKIFLYTLMGVYMHNKCLQVILHHQKTWHLMGVCKKRCKCKIKKFLAEKFYFADKFYVPIRMSWSNLSEISADNLKILPYFLGLQQSVNTTVQLWDDIDKEDFAFLITSLDRLNSDPLENVSSVLCMHGGNCNRKLLTKSSTIRN